jgi:hypothetical protein
MRVITFTAELEILHTMGELDRLDDQVNDFVRKQEVKRVVSVSDTCTTDFS